MGHGMAGARLAWLAAQRERIDHGSSGFA